MAKYLSTLLAGGLICWMLCGPHSRHLTADPTKDSAAPSKIAIVDMARVFTTSKSFQKERDVLNKQAAEMQETALKKTKELQDLLQKWKGLEPGSEERKELERRVQKKQAEFLEYQNTCNSKILLDQAQLYLATYRKAVPEIADFAQSHDIDLVIQSQPEPVDEADPVKLLQSLNRTVLYEHKLDITDEIIAALAEQ